MKKIIVLSALVYLTFVSELLPAQGPPDPGGSPVYEEPPLGGSAPLGDELLVFVVLMLCYLTYKLWYLKPRLSRILAIIR
ncbi:MAG TPA: hypothetical protein PK939_04225 [Bacteroidales bacterium]|nr:hypothetical protein [Bacteroidales bacterium]